MNNNTTICRVDCAYYSTYTDACDYRLTKSVARPCPATACTVYTPRNIPKSWQLRTGAKRFSDDEISIDCGHGVGEAEEYYVNDDGETICADCIESACDKLDTSEKAALLGYGETRIYGYES